jgi:hypothetical protein
MGEENKVGRPLKFKTVEELQEAINDYFDWCYNRTKRIWDDKEQAEKLVSDPAPYTMSGLARRIGLSRQGLIDYENRDAFLDAIKEARERVHEDVETRLMEKAPTGAIFNLKNNFGWKDSKELTGKDGKDLFPTPILGGNVSTDNGDTQAATPEKTN